MAEGQIKMGRVVDFNDRGKEAKRKLLTWERLARLSQSPKMVERVGAVTTQLVGKTVKVEPPELVRVDGDFEAGTVHYVSRTTMLATHENFPRYLFDKGLSHNQAVELAAGSLISYNSLAIWMAGLRRVGQQAIVRACSRRSMQPDTDEVWQAADYMPNVQAPQQPHVILHRMAARIALDVSAVRNFRPRPVEPQPVHVAALADPFTAENLREIGAVAENTFR